MTISGNGGKKKEKAHFRIEEKGEKKKSANRVLGSGVKVLVVSPGMEG